MIFAGLLGWLAQRLVSEGWHWLWVLLVCMTALGSFTRTVFPDD